MTPEEEKEELVEVLLDMVIDACYDAKKKCLDTMAMRSYSEAVLVLEKHGKVKVTREYGRTVEAEILDEQFNSSGCIGGSWRTSTP